MEESLGYRNLANLSEGQRRDRERTATRFPERFFPGTIPSRLENGGIPRRCLDFFREKARFMIVILEVDANLVEDEAPAEGDVEPMVHAMDGAKPVGEEADPIVYAMEEEAGIPATKEERRAELFGSSTYIGYVALGGQQGVLAYPISPREHSVARPLKRRCLCRGPGGPLNVVHVIMSSSASNSALVDNSINAPAGRQRVRLMLI